MAWMRLILTCIYTIYRKLHYSYFVGSPRTTELLMGSVSLAAVVNLLFKKEYTEQKTGLFLSVV